MARSISTWTVSIVIIHDGIHDHVYDEVEQSILQQRLTGGLRYVIFYFHLQKKHAEVKELTFHNNLPILKTIDSYSADIFDSHTLLKFFNEIVKPEGPAGPSHKHLLILKGHGAGMGFFAQRTADGGITMMPANQLADIIRQSIGKAAVLVPLCCYVQMLETGYVLRGVADMIVAPQTTITFYGIHYAKLFAMLEADPAASLQAIGENITHNFLPRYYEEPFLSEWKNRYQDEQDPNLVSLSANYTHAYAEIVDCVNALTDWMMPCFEPGNEALFFAIRRARENCGELTPSGAFGYIDLHFFMQQLEKEAGPDAALQQLMHRFFRVREKCMAALHMPPGPPDLYAPSTKRGRSNIKSPLYLSIFFPAFAITDEQLAIREMYTQQGGPLQSFNDACRWGQFIFQFFQRT